MSQGRHSVILQLSLENGQRELAVMESTPPFISTCTFKATPVHAWFSCILRTEGMRSRTLSWSSIVPISRRNVSLFCCRSVEEQHELAESLPGTMQAHQANHRYSRWEWHSQSCIPMTISEHPALPCNSTTKCEAHCSLQGCAANFWKT